jgi:hypothetical protein
MASVRHLVYTGLIICYCSKDQTCKNSGGQHPSHWPAEIDCEWNPGPLWDEKSTILGVVIKDDELPVLGISVSQHVDATSVYLSARDEWLDCSTPFELFVDDEEIHMGVWPPIKCVHFTSAHFPYLPIEQCLESLVPKHVRELHNQMERLVLNLLRS